MKVLKWLDDHFEETLMMIALWVIVVVMGMQVVFRYALKSSLSFPEELCRYSFIYLTFLGLSYAIKTNTHIRIDILETLIPKLKKPLQIIGDIVFLAFCIYMLKPAYTVVTGLIATNQTSPAMELPMWIVYLSLLIGFILTIIRIVQKYICQIINRNKEKKVGDPLC